MPDRSRAKKRGAAREYQHTNRREPNSPRLIRRLKPASIIEERWKHSPWTHFAHLQIHSHINKREKAQPPLAETSVNCNVYIEVVRKLGIGTASGWLQRLIGDRAVIHQREEVVTKWG